MSSSSESLFANVPLGPVDPILGVALAYNADQSPNKVNLGVGAYRDDAGKPFVLSSVRQAEKRLVDSNQTKEYLPIEGLAEFRTQAQKLIFGAESEALKSKRVATTQSLSGTGALRIGAEYILKFLPKDTPILISDPTWSNHHSIFGERGIKIINYRYFHPKTNGLDFDGLIADFKAAPNGSLVLLHVCAHNPTGCDPTKEQWKEIAAVCKEKSLVPFFDCAYQGFATGNIEGDAFSVRYFVEQGFELLLAQSFAKNFGLYGERAGAMSVVCKTEEIATKVMSQLKLIIRPMYSNPPQHGAYIVSTILSDPQLNQLWVTEVKGMSERIQVMRKSIFDILKEKGTPGDWSHIINQIGMFAYTGLSENQVQSLINNYHIHMVKNGRISMAGLNTGNVRYVAESIHAVVTANKL